MATVNADKIQVHGHCGCGKAQYTVTLTPPDAPECYLRGACHCTTCSRINGSPYIWTSHWVASTVKWVGATQPPPPAAAPDSSPDEVTPDYLASFLGDRLDTWESLAGRKWKLRCRHCGSPMGTWNRVTGRYSLWPTTLARGPKSEEYPEGALIGLEYFRPTMHQFYAYRTTNVNDDLPKWSKYPGSQQLDNYGIAVPNE